jgi:hypothetical protein
MRDQSHGRINGSAAAAFATICERNRNTVSVLKERRRVRRRFVGQRYAQRFANPSRAVDKLFCNERSAAGSVNESFPQLMCSNDTAIQPIDRGRRRNQRDEVRLARSLPSLASHDTPRFFIRQQRPLDVEVRHGCRPCVAVRRLPFFCSLSSICILIALMISDDIEPLKYLARCCSHCRMSGGRGTNSLGCFAIAH